MKADIYSPRPETLPGRVIAYFRRLPDEELSVTDIALKFDEDKNSIHAKLKLAHEYDMLKRDGQVYSAGPEIGEPEAGTRLAAEPAKPRRSATAGFSSPRHAIDFSTLKVDEGIPAPAKGEHGTSKWDPLFAMLKKAGQSIATTADLKGALAAEAAKRNRRGPGKFKVAKTSATEARIWRIA